MHTDTRKVKSPIAALIALAAVVLAAHSSAATAAGTDALISKHPTQSPAEGHALAAEIVKLGPSGMKDVCAALVELGTGNDSKARFALHGLALYVTRPGAQAECGMLEKVILEAIPAAASPEVKAFLMEQLKLVAHNASIEPLSGFLSDDRLCEPATQALLMVRTPEANAAFARALPNAKGKHLVTILRALGELREKSVSKAIMPHASSEDATLRQTAWFALANIGDAAAADVLTKAADSRTGYEKTVATSQLLLLASRLAEAGDRDPCVKICRHLMETRTAPREANVYISALTTMRNALGKGAAPDILSAIDHKDMKISIAALHLLESIEGIDLTAQMTAKMKAVSPECRAAMIRIMERGQDKAALPAIKAAMIDENPAVRGAAIKAFAAVGGKDAVEPLIALLASAKAEEAGAAKSALMSIRSDGFSAAIAAAVKDAAPAAKATLIEILGARGASDQLATVLEAASSQDAALRMTALRTLSSVVSAQDAPRLLEMLMASKAPAERAEIAKAVLAACRKNASAAPILAVLPKAEGEARAELFKLLARLGGDSAMQAVLADTKSENAAAREAAIRCLSDWSDASAAPALLALARDSKEPLHHVLALRGYLRMLTLQNTRTTGQTIEMLKQAMAATQTPDDKKIVLGGLSGIRHPDAALLAATCLDVEPIKAEAAATVIAMICPTKDQAGLRGAGIADALGKAGKAVTNEALRKKANEYLAKLSK